MVVMLSSTVLAACFGVHLRLRRAGGWSGLPRVGHVIGLLASSAASVVGAQSGLGYSGASVSPRYAVFFGDGGRGIRTASFLISPCASLSWFSKNSTFLWCSPAHNSMLSWNLARCWFQATLASVKKASASLTLVSWVVWQISCCDASLVRSMMACQTSLAKVWYVFAVFASSHRSQASPIFSLPVTQSYKYLVPSARVW